MPSVSSFETYSLRSMWQDGDHGPDRNIIFSQKDTEKFCVFLGLLFSLWYRKCPCVREHIWFFDASFPLQLFLRYIPWLCVFFQISQRLPKSQAKRQEYCLWCTSMFGHRCKVQKYLYIPYKFPFLSFVPVVDFYIKTILLQKLCRMLILFTIESMGT